MEVVRAFLEDGGKVPGSEDGNGLVTSDVPWFWGALVIGMANSSLVIGLGVSNTGGGMLLTSEVEPCLLLPFYCENLSW